MRQVASEEERRKREGSFPLGAKSVGEKKKEEKEKKGARKEKQGRKEEERGRKEKKERISRRF